MLLEDGAGSGRKLKIDSHNRAFCFADTRGLISHVSMTEQESYAIGTPRYAIPTDDEYKILWVKNTKSGFAFVISKIISFWNGGTIAGDVAMDFTINLNAYVDDGIPSANQVEIDAQNLNLGSGNIAEMTTYIWNGATGTGMTSTGGSPFAYMIFHKGLTDLDLNDSIIVPFNKILCLAVQGERDGIFSLIVSGFFIDLDFV